MSRFDRTSDRRNDTRNSRHAGGRSRLSEVFEDDVIMNLIYGRWAMEGRQRYDFNRPMNRQAKPRQTGPGNGPEKAGQK